MGGDGLADHWAGSRHEVEDASGDADLVHDLGQQEGVDRGNLRGLDHHGAPNSQGRGHLVGDLVEGVVPRGDAANDADGLTHDERGAHLILVGEARRTLGCVGEGPGRQADLDEARHERRHAHLVADGFSDFCVSGDELFRHLAEKRTALGHGQRRPSRERSSCSSNRCFDILGSALRNGGEDLFGAGIDDLDGGGAGRRDPCPVDVER